MKQTTMQTAAGDWQTITTDPGIGFIAIAHTEAETGRSSTVAMRPTEARLWAAEILRMVSIAEPLALEAGVAA